MAEMNPEIKAAWVAALRSGNYKQGQGRLRNRDTFCCLGVLCDISDLGEWDKWDEYAIEHRTSVGTLPVEVVRWAGLFDTNPYAGDDRLAVMNDYGAPFDAIADAIEEHL